jgi:hypothetical protein
MAQNGNVILVGLGGRSASYIIGGAKSCRLSADGDMIEISSADSAKAREFIAGRTSWQVTINYLVADFKRIQNINGSQLTTILSVGNKFTLYFGERSSSAIGTNYVSGSAFLKNVDIVATQGNLIQGSLVFQGSGELT